MEFPRCSKGRQQTCGFMAKFWAWGLKISCDWNGCAVSITAATGKFLFVCHHKMGDVLKLEMEFPESSKGRQQTCGFMAKFWA